MMEAPVDADNMRRVSVHSLLRRLPQGAKSKNGFIFCMRSREAGPDRLHELYFTVHWAVLQSGFLFLFDSSISQSFTEAIWLAGCRMEAAVHRQRELWPPCCTQLFSLTTAGGTTAAATWQLGSPRTDDWQLELASAAAAASVSASAGDSGDAALRRLLGGARASPPLTSPAAAADEAEVDGGGGNLYHAVEAVPAADTAEGEPPTPAQPAADGGEFDSVYDTCTAELSGGAASLHSLISGGGTGSFALDYVAAAVHTGEKADDGSLWSLLTDSDSGTFLLTGFCQRHPGQPMQIAVKADGFVVKTLSLVMAGGGRFTLIGDYGRTFDSIEHLVFHYHLSPITVNRDGTGVYLTCAYGYDRGRNLPVRTILFSSCLWTVGDKDVCSSVLLGSAVGTYSLRAGDSGGYVLSVQSQGIVAKLRVYVATENGRTQFSLASSIVSGLRFASLEDLLARMHQSRFPLVLSKSHVEMTLQIPFQLSSACRSRLQSQLLEPLRQKIFHRGSECQAEAPLTLPSAPAGAFIVWLCAASEVVLMARSDVARRGTTAVSKFRIICEATGCRHLAQRQFYLDKHPSIRFDSIEALVAHLQCSRGLLVPELRCTLRQPVNCRT